MLCDFAQKKRIYRKGLTQAFDKKKCQFRLYLDLVRLEIMLSDFAEKNETCFDYKKQNFLVQKIRFSKVVNPCFGQKVPFCFFI